MQDKLIAVGAAAYGALVAWAVTADHYDQKLKAKEDYIEELRSRSVAHNYFYQNLNATTQDYETDQNGSSFRETSGPEIDIEEDGTVRTTETQNSEAENPRGDETAEVDEAGVTEDDSAVPSGETPEETRGKLQSIIDQYTHDNDDGGPSFADVGTAAIHDPRPPFVISRAKYSWDEEEGDNYEKITVTYYPRQRVVLDEDEELIDDVGNTLGWKNLSQFGGESGDPDTVFIRNQRLETDFEVVRDDESPLPLHIQYGMGKEEFKVNKAAGTLRLRDEDLVD